MSVEIITADALDGLGRIPDASINCVVTSPPYWGLRDYGSDGQIGLEKTPEEFVVKLVAVFREVRRVLRKDGTLWLNLGDSYNNFRSQMGPGQAVHGRDKLNGKPDVKSKKRGVAGLKEKDLVGIPWMTAFALRADGWYLRQEIIWAKPNPMPESVKDRCTRAHEHIFLLTKAERYWFDAGAIREPATDTGRINGRDGRDEDARARPPGSGPRTLKRLDYSETGRNKRSVWTINTKGYSEAHFATFPPNLPETCIRAGCPAGGVVLDPFGGAGTTALVAERLGRNSILIEINHEYAELARRRIARDRLTRGSGSMADVSDSGVEPTPLESLIARQCGGGINAA